MPRKLPPLNALPSFEAAARHLSFSRAAEELHVTHGAISRAVKNIEEQLDIQLFERGTRMVRLTAIGEPYAQAVRDALDQLAAATTAATARHSSRTLNVSTSDGFAGRWLVPRLYRFHRANSDIDVRISTTGKLTKFLNDGIDLAIRYGGGEYPGLTSELLTGEEVFPVCSPRLLQGKHPLREPKDLTHHTLIHDGYPITWATWLKSAGITDLDAHSGLTFDSATFAVESAVQGEGVVLGRTMLVAADLASGRLVRPFEHALKASSKYFVVYPPRAIAQPEVKAFRDWLFAEMRASESGASSKSRPPRPGSVSSGRLRLRRRRP